MTQRKMSLALLATAALVATPSFAATTLSVTAAAALEGGFGLQVNFDGTGGSAYVQDNSPTLETVYWVVVRVNDNDLVFSPPTGGSFQFLRAFTTDAAAGTVFRINVIPGIGGVGNQRVFVLPMLDSGVFHPTGSETFITTAAAPPVNDKFVFEWNASTGPGMNDGSMRTYRGGVLRKSILSLDTDLLRIEMIRMGGFGNTISVGSGSELYLDDFQSYRAPITP